MFTSYINKDFTLSCLTHHEKFSKIAKVGSVMRRNYYEIRLQTSSTRMVSLPSSNLDFCYLFRVCMGFYRTVIFRKCSFLSNSANSWYCLDSSRFPKFINYTTFLHVMVHPASEGATRILMVIGRYHRFCKKIGLVGPWEQPVAFVFSTPADAK